MFEHMCPIRHAIFSSSILLFNLVCDAQLFADLQEEERYEAVEKEYETVAELAKEDELELRYVLI